MEQLIVRNVPQDVKDRLKAIAERRGVGMEVEVRAILERAVMARGPVACGLGTRFAVRFAQVGLEQPIAEMRHGPARSAIFADGPMGNGGS